jgi:hypothetical protein
MIFSVFIMWSPYFIPLLTSNNILLYDIHIWQFNGERIDYSKADIKMSGYPYAKSQSGSKTQNLSKNYLQMDSILKYKT